MRSTPRRALRFALLACAALGFAGYALAHHSFAMFDKSKEITVQGTVKAFNYTNPHSWLDILVTDDKGQTKEWSFEMEGPSTLMRAGIKPGSLKPGDKITVRAWPLRDGRPAGAALSITKEDGTVLDPRKGLRPPTT
jgi:Family of unknown function (DUF6152)